MTNNPTGMKVVAWVVMCDDEPELPFKSKEEAEDEATIYGTGNFGVTIEPLVTLADAEEMVRRAFDAGFVKADEWSCYEYDLSADLDSGRYLAEREETLSKLGEKGNG